MTKIYKIEISVLDFDDIGREAIHSVIENIRYPNDCISPTVISIEERDVGDWHDDHPLNRASTFKDEYTRIFQSALTHVKGKCDVLHSN